MKVGSAIVTSSQIISYALAKGINCSSQTSTFLNSKIIARKATILMNQLKCGPKLALLLSQLLKYCRELAISR